MLGNCGTENTTIPPGLDGTGAIVPVLTSSSVALLRKTDLTIDDFSPAVTIFRVYQDNTEIDLAPADVTVTPASGGDITYTVLDEGGGNGLEITITALATTVDFIELNIAYANSGITFNSKYSIGVVNKGDDSSRLIYSDKTEYAHPAGTSNTALVLKSLTIPTTFLAEEGDAIRLSYSTITNPGDPLIARNLIVDINGSVSFSTSKFPGPTNDLVFTFEIYIVRKDVSTVNIHVLNQAYNTFNNAMRAGRSSKSNHRIDQALALGSPWTIDFVSNDTTSIISDIDPVLVYDIKVEFLNNLNRLQF